MNGRWKGMDKLGWSRHSSIALVRPCAWRAFNTNIDVIDKRYFQGLPVRPQPGLIAGLVWAMESYDVARAEQPLLAWALTLFAGITMVSSVRFYSGRTSNLRKACRFRIVVMIALSVVSVDAGGQQSARSIFTVFASYAASGYVMWVWERLRKKKPIPPAG